MECDKNGKLRVPLDLDTLEQYCLWIIFKFINDPFHQQQNSSRGDLIGGFIDRWINKIPESIIFRYLLKKYNRDNEYNVLNDFFYYSDETAKNAPDILGLIDNKNKIYKFAEFNEDKWYTEENAPFIEMKTFRKTQKLITIPKTQFLKNRYFAFVEAHVDELYLLYLFDYFLFKKYENLSCFRDNSEFIVSNSKDIIKAPKDVINIKKLTNEIEKRRLKNNVGFYELLGIYTTKSLAGYYTTVSKISNKDNNDIDVEEDESFRSEKPRYLDDVKQYNYDHIPNVPSGEYYYFKEVNCIPIFLTISNNSKLIICSRSEKKIIFHVEGEVNIKSSSDEDFDKSFKDEFFYMNFESCIRNKIKYYYLTKMDKEDDILCVEETELKSGIFMYYGDEFKNNKFKILDEGIDFFICESKKTVLRFYIGEDSKIHCVKNRKSQSLSCKKGFNEIKFTQTGNCTELKHLSNQVIPFKLTKNDVNPVKLNIKLISEDSELKFIEKRAHDCIIRIKGKVIINDEKFNDEEFNEEDSKFYSIIFKNKKDKLIIEHSEINDPIIEENEEPFNDAFYYHLKDSEFSENNVPVKINVGEGSEIRILKINKTSVFVKTEGNKIYIDDYDVSSDKGCVWKLNFKIFDRSSKKEEIVLSKGAISGLQSDEQKLIKAFDTFIENN